MLLIMYFLFIIHTHIHSLHFKVPFFTFMRLAGPLHKLTSLTETQVLPLSVLLTASNFHITVGWVFFFFCC